MKQSKIETYMRIQGEVQVGLEVQHRPTTPVLEHMEVDVPFKLQNRGEKCK